jgi:uncharacterized DUF497 family protein
MEVIYDAAKDAINKKKHGVSLTDRARIAWHRLANDCIAWFISTAGKTGE